MGNDRKVTGESLTPRIIGRAMDQMPLTPALVAVTVIAAMGYLFDNMDNLFLAYALPSIAKEFSLQPQTIGLIASVGLVGMAVGSFAWGWIADRWGRRMAFSATILIFSLFTGLLAASFSVGFIIGVRFLAGTGLGGAIPVDSSLVTEYAPARIRGRLNGALPAIWPVGQVLASGCALLIVPALGWRGLFLVGILPALLTAWVRRRVPESPRWLANRGRFEESRKALHFIGVTDEALARARAEDAAEPPAPEPPRPRFLDLFAPELRWRTIHTWLIWGLPLIAAWGMNLWMPTFFVKLYHIQLSKTLTYLFLISFIAVAGRFTVYFLVDKLGRKPFIIFPYAIAGIVALMFGLVETEAQLVAAFACYSFFENMGSTAITIYAPEVFPLHIRALGTSSAMGIGRIGGAIAPYVIGVLMGSGHVGWIWIMISATLIAPAAVTIWMGIETRGRNLEQLSILPVKKAKQALG